MIAPPRHPDRPPSRGHDAARNEWESVVIVSLRRMAAVAAGLGLVVAVAGLALADGLPPPKSGVTDGPTGDEVRRIVESHGLSCTPDQGVDGEPELFCLRQDAPSLTLTANFYTDPALVLVAGATGSAPLAAEGRQFLAQLAGLYCAADPAQMAAYVEAGVAQGSGQPSDVFTDATCEVHLQASSAPANPPTAAAFLTAFALAAPGDAVGGPAAAPSSGVPFADSIVRPGAVNRDPIVILESAALAAAVVFLMPFPAQLFNSTLEEHEDEVRRWLRLDRGGEIGERLRAFWASWPGVAAFTAIAALLYGFLDPTFGLTTHSAATFLGMLIALVVVTLLFALPGWLAHRRAGDPARIRVVPISLGVALLCVVVSRLTGFQPGYLYGLLIGLAFARELGPAQEGRATALSAGVMLAAAVAAWFMLGGLAPGDGLVTVVGRTALGAILVAGLEGVVFGLLPFRFLPGETLRAWNRVAWGTLLGIGAFAFFHILVNPASGYLADSSRTPLLTIVILLVAFSAISVAFWAWFRFRSPEPRSKDAPAA
jgi:hypothetical protein